MTVLPILGREKLKKRLSRLGVLAMLLIPRIGKIKIRLDRFGGIGNVANTSEWKTKNGVR